MAARRPGGHHGPGCAPSSSVATGSATPRPTVSRRRDGSAPRSWAAVSELLARVPPGGRGLAIGHTPLIERAVLGLTGREIAPLRELEGVLLVEEDDGAIRVEELRDP